MSDTATPPAPSQEPTPPAPSNGEPTPPANQPPSDPKATPPGGTPPPSDPGANPPPADPPADPPKEPDLSGEDWRKQYAGDDEKKLNVLSRYPSQKAALDALFAARNKIAEGDKTKLPENATDEQKAAYRAEHGIPETPEAYLDNLGEGLVIGDEDKEGWKPVLEELHAENVPQDMINKLVQHKLNADEAAKEARLEADSVAAEQADEELREEWGQDYKANKNMIKNAISLFFPEDMHENIENARLADGTPLFATKGGAMAFAEMARKLAPHGTTVNSEGVSDIGTIESNLVDLQKQMGTPAWYQDKAKQKQYQDYVDAYKRNTGKDWTGSPQ